MTTEEIIINILHTMVDFTSLSRLKVSEQVLNNLFARVAKTILKWRKFEIKDVIGEGSYAVVILTKDNDVIKITTDKDDANNSNKIKLERHKNVVFTKDVAKIAGIDLFIIYQEYAGTVIREPHIKRVIDNGRLEDVNLQIKYFREKAQIDKRFNGIADGLEWLRSKGIEYHDVHDKNVLEKDGEFVIIDLGLTSKVAPDTGIKSLKLENKLEDIFMKEI